MPTSQKSRGPNPQRQATHPKSRNEELREPAHPAGPEKSGATSWREHLAVIVAGTMSRYVVLMITTSSTALVPLCWFARLTGVFVVHCPGEPAQKVSLHFPHCSPRQARFASIPLKSTWSEPFVLAAMILRNQQSAGARRYAGNTSPGAPRTMSMHPLGRCSTSRLLPIGSFMISFKEIIQIMHD